MSNHNKKNNDQGKGYQTKLTMFIEARSKSKEEKVDKSREKQVEKVEKKPQTHHRRQQKKDKRPDHYQSNNQSNHSNTDRFSSISARSNSPKVRVEKKEPPKKLNVDFYLNKMRSQPFGQQIDVMHQRWYNNFDMLQRNHAYIQWIFPNSFQSRFNIHAQPLSREQAEEFRTNPDIIKRYLKSYDMMLSFYGMKLKDKFTGEIVRSRCPSYKERFYKTFLTSFHNHMRITRILTSLKETGFGKFAAELSKFLKYEIYHQSGEMGSLKKYNVYKDWLPYETFVEQNQPVSIYFSKNYKPKHTIIKPDLLTVEPKQKNKQDSIRESRSHSKPKSRSHSRSPSMKPQK